MHSNVNRGGQGQHRHGLIGLLTAMCLMVLSGCGGGSSQEVIPVSSALQAPEPKAASEQHTSMPPITTSAEKATQEKNDEMGSQTAEAGDESKPDPVAPTTAPPDSAPENAPTTQEREENTPPYADIETQYRYNPGDTVVLDGSYSDDWDGDPLTYQWQLVSKPNESDAKLSNATSVKPTFFADVSGRYVVSLTVNDGTDNSATTTREISVYQAPVANAGKDQSILIGETAHLDGSNSSGADGAILAFNWALLSSPTYGYVTYNASYHEQVLSFKPEQPGTYKFELSVVDSNSYDHVTDQVVLTVNAPVKAHAGDDQRITANAMAVLDGSLSRGPITGGREAPDAPISEFRWTLLDSPKDGVFELLDADKESAQFQASSPGNYDFSLDVIDDGGNKDSDTVRVTVEHPIHPLPNQIIDAEYSKTLNRIVLVAANPSALYVYDPTSHTSERVDLALSPGALSVSPSGDYVAVGHDSKLSVIDLHAMRVESIVDIPLMVDDVVLTDEGYAYAFPFADWQLAMYVVNTATGEKRKIEGYGTDFLTVAKLHHSNRYIYRLDGDYSSHVTKYEIDKDSVTQLRTLYSPSSLCGRMWFSEDGQRLLSGCGVVLKTTESESTDLEYNGRLENTDNDSMFSAIQHSQAADRIFALELQRYHYFQDDEAGRRLRVYDYEFLTESNQILLPRLYTQAGTFYTGGKYLFVNTSGTQVFVIVQAEEESESEQDFGLVVYDVKDL